ncbi:MAG: DUF4007 family protein, partial [Flavobacterium sp.]
NFVAFVKRRAEEAHPVQFNENTISTDFDVLTKMYIRTNEQSKDREDTFSGLLTELGLIQAETRRVNDKLVTFYSIPSDDRNSIPQEIFLYCILSDDSYDKSINVSSIEQSKNSPGAIFAMGRAGIVTKLESIIADKSFKRFSGTLNYQAGIRELQLQKKA